jgi:4-hydroxy-2-oxoheptanedioate aldolase
MTKINTFLKIPNTFTSEMMGAAGFDFITIDMQHGIIDYQMMVSMLQSLEKSDARTLVRVPWNEPSIIMRVLDAGASGIICPMINSQKEAISFVKATQYPPEGIRSFGPIRAKLSGSYTTIQESNEYILKFAMIETQEAINNLEEIALTKGLTGLYVGPSDLSISLGLKRVADFTDSRLTDALRSIAKVAKKRQLIAATQVYGLEQAKIAIALGFDVVTPIDDSTLFENALKEKIATIKKELL